MATRNVSFEDATFVTWYEDLKRNTDELMQNSILEPWTPLYKMDPLDPAFNPTNPPPLQPLDPNFNPWRYE